MAHLLSTILSTLFPQYKLVTVDMSLPVNSFSFDEEEFGEDDFGGGDLKDDDEEDDDLWFPGDDENGDDDFGFGNDEDFNY